MPILSQIQLLALKLKQDQIIALPVNGIYYLATRPSRENASVLAKITQSSYDLYEVLFRNVEEMKQYEQGWPVYTRFLANSLLPNSIALVVNSQNFLSQKQIICHAQSNPQIQELLQEIDSPLLITPAHLSFLPPATSSRMLQNYFGDQITVFLPKDAGLTGIAPTILDCTEDKNTYIWQPGLVSEKEIRSILPSNVQLGKKWQIQNFRLNLTQQHKSFFSQSEVMLVNNFQARKDQIAVVLGSKEKLRENFNLGFLPFFYCKQVENYLLLNLGSQSNLENIARNLLERIFEAGQMGVKAQILLNQHWGSGLWAQIINFYLQKYTLSPAQAQEVEERESFAPVGLVLA